MDAAAAGPDPEIGPRCNVQNFDRFFEGLAAFTAVAFPAAMVNSGLKYMQKQIQLAFMRRLTHHLHERYCANRAYYAASVLGGDPPFQTPFLNKAIFLSKWKIGVLRTTHVAYFKQRSRPTDPISSDRDPIPCTSTVFLRDAANLSLEQRWRAFYAMWPQMPYKAFGFTTAGMEAMMTMQELPLVAAPP